MVWSVRADGTQIDMFLVKSSFTSYNLKGMITFDRSVPLSLLLTLLKLAHSFVRVLPGRGLKQAWL